MLSAFLFAQPFRSQTREIDSLSNLALSAKEDTNKVKVLVMLSFKLMITGEYVRSYLTTEQIIPLSEKLNFKLGLANAYATRGLLYQYQGDYPKALQNLLHSLEIFDAIKSKKGVAYSMNNIGSIYVDMKDYTKAIEYFDKTLELKKSLNDKKGIASTYNNIGIIYQEKATANPNGPSFGSDVLMALKYFSSASEIYKSLDYPEDNAYIESNIGMIYLLQDKYDLAKAYIERSLKIFEENEIKDGIASSHINLGALAVKLGQTAIAKKHYETALSISTDMGNYTATKDCYEGLYKFYLKQNDCKLALSNYQLFINYRDSLLNQENTKKVVQAQMNYEFEKKIQIAKLEQEKKDVAAREEKQKQVYIRNSLIGGFAVLLLFAIFIYRSYRSKQKSNIQLENMNKIIIEKNKNITDSINYAKRIQTALMPSDKYIDKTVSRLSKK